MNGIEEITQERNEQIEKHGRTVELDAKTHSEGDLVNGAFFLLTDEPFMVEPPNGWSDEEWVYLASKSYRQRLIIAGALLCAEIDRLDCIEQQKEKV